MPVNDTTKILVKLRSLMKNVNGKEFSAYICPSSDAHGSEYLSEKDKRRQFLSGFTGSSGTAVLTNDHALLWTDGRYFLQATQELDSNWQLMKDGLPETPSIGDWLCNNLGSGSYVGIDATLYEEDLFSSLSSKLKTENINIEHIGQNLVDLVRNEYEKPILEYNPLIKLEEKYVGKSTSTKLKEIRDKMKELNTDSLVITSLDEIAWLMNMRCCGDIPFGTVFFAYVLITHNKVKLFINLKRLEEKCDGNITFRQYLLAEDKNFEFYEYEEFYSYFTNFVNKEYIQVSNTNQKVKRKIFLSSASNHAIHSIVPAEFIHKDLSLLLKFKVIKNESEIESAKRIHTRDSATLVEFFYQIDKHFSTSEKNSKDSIQFSPNLNEFELAKYVDNLRASQLGFLTPSFETICSFGSNGAIIHYKPQEGDSNNKKIESNNLLLLDSGGHYLDMGTTDVTRTFYLGNKETISDYQKECFTRVLKGHIQLSSRVFPSGTHSTLLDSFARQALWEVGLDYRHGTGHGVGALLNVHEMPIMSNRKSVEIGLKENMIVTIEPGYYEDGNFGIRIENCVLIVKEKTKFNYSNSVEFVKFEPLTYVPIQKELIQIDCLNEHEIKWLNDYHMKCLCITGEELKKSNKLEVLEWLREQTKPLSN